MKALLWLNGGSAAAFSRFFGARTRQITPAFGEAIVSFGVRVFLSVVAFVMAYVVQLQYGNKGLTRSTRRLHYLAVVPRATALRNNILAL